MSNATSRALPDYHTHHRLCRHASGTPVDYARIARQKGIREIAATDHCPTDVGFGREHRMTLEEFDQYRQDVFRARADVPEVAILFGIEADYYPHCEPFLAKFTDQHAFDIVLGSIHFRDYWASEPRRRGVTDPEDHPNAWREYYTLTAKLADTGLYDVVTHMDLPKRFGSPAGADSIREYVLPSLDRIAAAGMAIEINTSGWTHSINEAYPSLHVLTWAAERGIGLVFGSDAHQPDRVGDGFDIALDLVKQAGFTHARTYRSRRWTEYALP